MALRKTVPTRGWSFSHAPRFIDAPVTRPMPAEDAPDEATPVFTSDPYTRVMSPVKKVLERPRKGSRRRSGQTDEGVARRDDDDDLDRSSLFATSNALRGLPADQDESDGAVAPSPHVDTAAISEAYARACRGMKVVPSSYYVTHCGHSALDMKHQGLGPVGTTALACSLLNNPYVSQLDLTDNAVGTEGAHCIAELLQDSNCILQLSVADNQLGLAGLAPIVHVLDTFNNTLTALNLAENRLDDTCVPMLAHLLKATYVLSSLNLSHNQIGEQGGVVLGPALAYNNTLTELDLTWNCLRRKGAVAVALGVKDNATLKKLHLAWNGFCAEGAKALDAMLRDNHVLEELDLSHNRIDDEGAKHIARGLARNSGLQVVKLIHNPMQSPGCTAICTAMLKKDACVLRTLDLREMVVDKTCEQLRATLSSKHPSLRVHLANESLTRRGKARLHPMIKIINYIEKNKMKLVDFFNMLDKDGGMSVDKEEFIEGLEELGIHLVPEEIELLLTELDKDGDGEINYSEMVIGHQDFTNKNTQMIRLKLDPDEPHDGEDGDGQEDDDDKDGEEDEQ